MPQHSAEVLGLDPWTVVKTLVMQDEKGAPLIVLMHGNCAVSTKNLAPADRCEVGRAVRARGRQPAQRLPGGRRGYLLGIAPEVCVRLLGAQPVDCALET